MSIIEDNPISKIDELISKIEILTADDDTINGLYTDTLNDYFNESQEFLGPEWFEETEPMRYMLKCTEPECAQYLISQLKDIPQ